MSDLHIGVLIGIALGAMWWDYLKGRIFKPKSTGCDLILAKLMQKHDEGCKWMGREAEFWTSINIVANDHRYIVTLRADEEATGFPDHPKLHDR